MTGSINTETIAETESADTSPILAAQGLSKRYAAPGGTKLVLDAVDLSVRRGEFQCIVGPSGAGKTTALH